ncbi:MAG TPA: transaldolase family protein [Anaerolineaceae bacterium]
MSPEYKSPLQQMALTTPTDFWNDSGALAELNYALDNGAVGATTNPVIVLQVLKQEMSLWKDRLEQIIRDHPTWSEVEVAWQISQDIALRGAELLLPVFEREHGCKGRISLQTNPAFYRDSAAIVAQGRHFAGLAPNIQVKIPVTAAGIEAAEQLTYEGIVTTATVSFTVPQVIAVAEAVERGLRLRAAEGKPVENIVPAAVLMVGRLDDWLQALIKRDGIPVDPGVIYWAGIAVFKRAHEIFHERGYRSRLLGAAVRSVLHWTELIGADAAITIPYEWQLLINRSGLPVKNRIDEPVDPRILGDLQRCFPDFRRAYEPDGMRAGEFETFGSTARTLRGFLGAYADLLSTVRDAMLPNPDTLKPAA